MNFIYYVNVKDLNTEKRQEFDAKLDRIAAMGEPHRPKSRVPSWWKSAEAATASSLEAARQMGFNVMIGDG